MLRQTPPAAHGSSSPPPRKRGGPPDLFDPPRDVFRFQRHVFPLVAPPVASAVSTRGEVTRTAAQLSDYDPDSRDVVLSLLYGTLITVPFTSNPRTNGADQI